MNIYDDGTTDSKVSKLDIYDDSNRDDLIEVINGWFALFDDETEAICKIRTIDGIVDVYISRDEVASTIKHLRDTLGATLDLLSIRKSKKGDNHVK